MLNTLSDRVQRADGEHSSRLRSRLCQDNQQMNIIQTEIANVQTIRRRSERQEKLPSSLY